MVRKTIFRTIIILILLLAWHIFAKEKLEYPETPKGDVIDNYHGIPIADPYRWLEEDQSETTQQWVKAQNEITNKYVDTPEREKIRADYAEMFSYTKYTNPYQRGDRIFYKKQEDDQNHYMLYMQKSDDSEPVVVFDPNQISDGGEVGLSAVSYSPDGKFAACGLSRSGNDLQIILIKDIDKGVFLADTIFHTRLEKPAWLHDNSGFYYSRFPAPGEVGNDEDLTFYQKLYFHKINTNQSEDVLIYSDDKNKRYGYDTKISADGRFLIIYVWRGTDRENLIYYKDLQSDGPVVQLINTWDAEFRFLGNHDNIFYLRTDYDAPMGRIVSVDINKPARSDWVEIIPEKEYVLEKAFIVNNKFVGQYLKDAYSVLRIYDLKGHYIDDISLPAIGAVYSIHSNQFDKHMFVQFASFLYPTTVFKYDFNQYSLITHFESDIDFDPSKFVTSQEFAVSKDGTSIPIFITHLKDINKDSSNPTILYGYGGFQSNQSPFFSTSKSLWIQQGGILAVAVTRGGSEYGEEWHRAGMLESKQNVYDDFIACAEYLIDIDYTTKDKLAIMGGSNGGLLVAACMNQRPELFGAVVCQVPLTDMLRFHKMGVGHWWQGEYGNAELYFEHFEFLYAYSPYHNVKKGVEYPPVLITTADGDDRVAPGHAKKYAAVLQEKYSGNNPILLRVEAMGGHGHTRAQDIIVNEIADTYAFLFKVFNMKFVE